jgi:cephalosporin hydroxylase
MNRDEIIKLLTEEQKIEILSLDGIVKHLHFLGGPQLANVIKNGEQIGWGHSVYKGVNVLQTKTDLENWKKIIEKYKPDIFIEMGVANGGNVIYINDLILEFGKTLEIYGVDIENVLNLDCKNLPNFTFFEDSTLSQNVINKIKILIDDNKDKKILIHFDDHHLSTHVLEELKTYSEMLKKNDIIIVGDTWDEGWYDSPFKALCDFLSENTTMSIDVELNQKMAMPCNWVFGILLKK